MVPKREERVREKNLGPSMEMTRWAEPNKNLAVEDNVSNQLPVNENARKANLYDTTIGSVTRGWVSSRYGEELYKKMQDKPNKADKYKAMLASDEYNFAPEGIIGEAVSGAAQLLGQQAKQLTDPATATLALGAGSTALLAGQAGPQLFVPEEIITVPAAIGAGFVAGSAAQNYKTEAGFAFSEMVEKGVDEDTARLVAMGVGVGNAALEGLQVDKLLQSFKILQATGGVATKGIASRIASVLLAKGIDVAQETGQEVAQELVTMAGTDVASRMSGLDTYTQEDYKDRLTDTAISSALSFGLMNAPGAIRNVASVKNGNGVPQLVSDVGEESGDLQPAAKVEENSILSEDNAGLADGITFFDENKGKNASVSSVSDRSAFEKLRNSIAQINDMEPVVELSGAEFSKGEESLVNRVLSFFDTVGNKVQRKDFGEVVLDKTGIKSTIAHKGFGRGKAITFAAVPNIIANGRQIDYQENWKGKNQETYIFAAPVNINNEIYYVAAVVRKNSNNSKYYLHEIVDGDGNVYYTKKENNSYPLKTDTSSQGEVDSGKALSSNPNIPQQKTNVNTRQGPLPFERGSATAEELRAYKKSMGIDPRTELEKVTESEKTRLASTQELARLKIISREDLEKTIESSEKKVLAAEKRQVNLDYQLLDKESGRVRKEAIANGQKEAIEYVEKLAQDKGLKVKYYSAPVESFGNGVINGDTMYINTSDPKTMVTTAVHETLHALKENNPEKYNRFLTAVNRYASANQRMNIIAAQAAEVYSDKDSIAYQSMLDENGEFSQAALEEEIAFKLAEEIVRDAEGLVEAVEGDRGIIEMFLEFIRKIKNSIAIKTSRSEAAMLDEAERTLVDFMRGEVGEVEGARFSIQTIPTTNKQYVKLDRQVINGDNPKVWVKELRKYINDEIRQGNDITVMAADGDLLRITADTAGKATFRNDIKMSDNSTRKMRNDEFLAKLRAESHIDELAQISTRGKNVTPDYKKHSFAKDGFNYRTAYFEDADGKYYKITMSVGIDGKINTIYNIGRMQIKEKFPLRAQGPNGNAAIENFSNTHSIPRQAVKNNMENKTSKKLPLEATKDTQKSAEQKKTEVKPYKKLSLDISSRPSVGTGGLSVSEYTRQVAQEVNGRTRKSADLQKRYEVAFADRVSEIFGVPNFDKQLVIKGMISDMSAGVKDVGYVTDSELGDLFETAYDRGIQVNGELYEEYKGLKDEVRKARFEPLEGREYEQFREQYSHKIFFKEGGESIDSFYNEVNERYPGLLDMEVTNQYDRMWELGRAYDSIVKQEQSLAEYLGKNAEDFKEDARTRFMEAANDFMRDVGGVGRFEESIKRVRQEAIDLKNINVTVEDVKLANKKVQKLVRERDRIAARYLITEEDNKIIDKLMTGKLELGDVTQNKYAIEQVYNARKAVEIAKISIYQYNSKRNAENQEEALELLATSSSWKDKKQGVRYSTDTAERNILLSVMGIRWFVV